MRGALTRVIVAISGVLIAGACRQHPTPTASEDARRVETPARLPLADVAPSPPRSPDDAGASSLVGDQPDAAITPRAPATDASAPTASPGTGAIIIEHAAGSDPRRILAVGGGQLYHLVGDHWQRLLFSEAEPRDVAYSHGELWVLARGTGANAGHILLLRSTRGDDLSVAANPALGPDCDPRALIVTGANEAIIAGANPSIVAITGNDVHPLARDIGTVISIRLLRDDTIVARHDAERVSLVRYGTVTQLTMGDYLDTVVDTNGTSYIVHSHGEFSRGRPGREYAVATTGTPFEPRAAAAFPGERLIAVGAGGPYAEWQRHDWRLTQGDFPRDPVAILPTDPPIVVGRDGMTSAVDPTGVRVLVPAPQH